MALYSIITCLPLLFRNSQTRRAFLCLCRDIREPVAPAGNFTRNNSTLHGKQVSPDSVQYPIEGYKNVNFPCAAAPFTVSPVPRALTCRTPKGINAALPRDSALYDVSVRQFASLYSGFLQTLPRGNALAFG